MSSLQVPVQLVLVGLNDSDILLLNTELSAMKMLTQTGGLDLFDAGAPRLLLRVFESKTLTSDTHLEVLVISKISAGEKRERMKRGLPKQKQTDPAGEERRLYGLRKVPAVP